MLQNKKRKVPAKAVSAGFCIGIAAMLLLSGCASGSQGNPSAAGNAGTISSSYALSETQNTNEPVSNGSGEPVSKTDMFFDTVVTITLYGENKESYIDECFDLARHYEDLFSNTIPSSDISRINDAEGDYVTIDPETTELLQAGLSYGTVSDGLFDITIGTLCDLWHFSDNDGEIPSEEEISQAVASIDQSAVSIKGNTAALTNPDAKIDLGGIAKGFIADRMRDHLKEEGITSGIINLGGNIVVIGKKPDGSLYKVGVQKPFSEQNEILAYLESDEISVVTSGVYERYFYVGDTLYHHILNPETGYPEDNGLLSVTIVSDSSTDGDGLSTTCFLLGLDQGMKLIEETPDIEAVFVTEDGKMHCSTGIEDRIHTP